MRIEITAEQAEQLKAEGKGKLVIEEHRYFIEAALPGKKESSKHRKRHVMPPANKWVSAEDNIVRTMKKPKFRGRSMVSDVYAGVTALLPKGVGMKRRHLEAQVHALVPEYTELQVHGTITRLISLGLIAKGG